MNNRIYTEKESRDKIRKEESEVRDEFVGQDTGSYDINGTINVEVFSKEWTWVAINKLWMYRRRQSIIVREVGIVRVTLRDRRWGVEEKEDVEKEGTDRWGNRSYLNVHGRI